jgi:hypothetical protein
MRKAIEEAEQEKERTITLLKNEIASLKMDKKAIQESSDLAQQQLDRQKEQMKEQESLIARLKASLSDMPVSSKDAANEVCVYVCMCFIGCGIFCVLHVEYLVCALEDGVTPL